MRSTKKPVPGFMGACLLAILGPLASQAQPPSNLPAPPSNQTSQAALRDFPRVQLIYYSGREGHGRKAVRCFELDKWATGKDVVISAEWIEGSADSLAANAESGRFGRRVSTRSKRTYCDRVWKVDYVDGSEDRPARLVIGGAGLPRAVNEIYGPDDSITLINLPNSAWHELGRAARLYRYYDTEQPAPPPSSSQNPQ